MREIIWKDRVFYFLFKNQQGVGLDDLKYLINPQPSANQTVLTDILNKDERMFCEDGLWFSKPFSDFHKDRSFSDSVFILTDIEATGSFPDRDSLIEIAAVKLVNGEIKDQFDSLVYTHKKIPPYIKKITGISNEKIKNAPDLDKVLNDFYEFGKDGIFCAHNAEFDFFFLNAVYLSKGNPFMMNKLPFCTLKLAEKILPDIKACGISSLAKHFDLEIKNRHRAMSDVFAAKQIFDILCDKIRTKNGDPTLHELFEMQLSYRSAENIKEMAKRKKKKLMKKDRTQ